MLQSAKTADLPRILPYLKAGVEDCIYMYIDIAKYGLENANMKVWFQPDESGEPLLVIMKYYNGMSIYSHRREFDTEATAELIRACRPGRVTGPKEMIAQLQPRLQAEYSVEYGYVVRYDERFPHYESTAEIRRAANAEELTLAAEIVAADESVGAGWSVAELAAQYKDRQESGFGRSCLLFEDGRPAAVYSTYAEFEDLAVMGGLCVIPEKRGRGYGGAIESYLYRSLAGEGFRVYSFAAEESRIAYHRRHQTPVAAEYGKLLIRE